ncbi:TPA: N-6 DNA methylase [Escherichia coli]|nr:N-6 DNA methylase [Escherichia coli]
MNKLSMGVFRCSSVSEILKYIRAITSHRAPIKYGVEKVEGKSYDRLRREANQKAIDLLNSLVDGATLTDEQRQILAGYTGEGGIGGSVSEYYTPKPIAEGVWEIMKLYGADVGNTLEPSAGTGVFNETKPVGTVMTATEISSVSGRINQLLHPEDSVQISPFEQLAVSTPNDSFDHVVGNVPFGGRDNTRNIDKPYAEETDMGSYFMLRMLDKIKPGGFMCVIVPPSIVSGSNMKRLRLRLSRKAEFLGAHRLPTGTFDAIHHLTLPWTPASIAQRNGRGARVGSNRASVRVHYYCGKGSFDEYRLKTLKRKAGWISDILRSDKSEMENADANDMIEMQMYTAKDDGERLAMMQVQMDKAKAAKRARQKEQATIDLQNYIKAQHAAGEDVEVLTAELERSKAELEKTTAEVAKFKQAAMAKAADNADWKARWGSVHHTDRMLLAQYRASLKSAIQRKANISQAISRYEKLLNRTQKAATDIKRLRPLVEDAINKGILDVDPDLVNHANEFLVIGDRSWRVGQYYDCAGDIVRIKSLDFDSQRADVEIIFTFKGTKSGNWDVKTLDKQVDVTPDEDAVMQKISGGVSIAGINDIISCDDFYRFQQRGMIKITDSYGVQTTESGYSIDFVGSYTAPLKHAVYPDRRDGALKSSIAKWVLGMMSEGNNRQIRSAETFLVELFGSNYGDVIASYGDTLSPEAIQEKIADAIARMPEKTSQGATRNGDSELEVTNAIFGTNEFRASDYEITTAQFGTIGIYSNKDEIKQAMDAASARIAAEREANLNHAVAALTQSWVTAIREAATTGKITPAIADVVNDGSKFMDAYQMDAVKLPSAYGQLSYRMTYNLVSMFSDLAILGLVDLNEVTPELLSMRKNHVEILQRINTALAGRTDEEKQADADRINLALGNITEEEIAARNEKQEELSSIQGDATSIAQSLGLNYRVSTADLKMMYAPKFAAGEVFGLQEASGMKGVLFRAKDAIKAKFGARWLPAKAKNSDFPGNWWIIETKHNVADVLAVIQQYA